VAVDNLFRSNGVVVREVNAHTAISNKEKAVCEVVTPAVQCSQFCVDSVESVCMPWLCVGVAVRCFGRIVRTTVVSEREMHSAVLLNVRSLIIQLEQNKNIKRGCV
jgi:hypothetical protein